MIDSHQTTSHTSVLTLDVQPRENPDWPVVRILIDGSDPFAHIAPGWHGFDPDEILGQTSPLLPDGDSSRVALYRCVCGEAGCGVIAPTITRTVDGTHIRWSDFRNYTGEFSSPRPIDPDALQPDTGRPWDLPERHFDATPYIAEVERASQDRTWESPARQTARLLRDQLTDRGLDLSPTLPLRAVVPAWDGDGMLVLFGRVHPDGRLDQTELRLTSADTDPHQAALDMAERLAATPRDEWTRTFPNQTG